MPTDTCPHQLPEPNINCDAPPHLTHAQWNAVLPEAILIFTIINMSLFAFTLIGFSGSRLLIPGLILSTLSTVASIVVLILIAAQ